MLEPAELRVHLQPGVLNDVLGVLRIPHQAEHDPVEIAAVPFDERAEGIDVASTGFGDNRRVALVHAYGLDDATARRLASRRSRSPLCFLHGLRRAFDDSTPSEHAYTHWRRCCSTNRQSRRLRLTYELADNLDSTIEESFPASDAPANTVITGVRVGPSADSSCAITRREPPRNRGERQIATLR